MKTNPPVVRQILIAMGLLIAVSLIAFLGSLATIPNTDGWYSNVTKVPWDPPNAVFAPVWSILYFLIAVAGWLIWRHGYRSGTRNAARKTLSIYAAQLVLNGIWTPVFFAGYPIMGKPAWWIALVIIVTLIGCVIWLGFSSLKWSKWASWIMVLYVLWLLFASTLNAGIIALN